MQNDGNFEESLNPAARTDFGWMAFGYISAKMYALTAPLGKGTGAASDMKQVFYMNLGQMKAFQVGWDMYMREIGRNES